MGYVFIVCGYIYKTESSYDVVSFTPEISCGEDISLHLGLNRISQSKFRVSIATTGLKYVLTRMVIGGAAFSASLYLDDQQLAYYPGAAGVASVKLAAKFPALEAGSKHVITVIQDHMGLEQNYGPGGDLHKVYAKLR